MPREFEFRNLMQHLAEAHSRHGCRCQGLGRNGPNTLVINILVRLTAYVATERLHTRDQCQHNTLRCCDALLGNEQERRLAAGAVIHTDRLTDEDRPPSHLAFSAATTERP